MVSPPVNHPCFELPWTFIPPSRPSFLFFFVRKRSFPLLVWLVAPFCLFSYLPSLHRQGHFFTHDCFSFFCLQDWALFADFLLLTEPFSYLSPVTLLKCPAPPFLSSRFCPLFICTFFLSFPLFRRPFPCPFFGS